MLHTPSIQEIPSTRPDLLAFRVTGTVTRDAFAAMGERVLDVFEGREGRIDMLLHFDAFEGAEAFAGFSAPAIASRLRALARVGAYVVAEAPAAAAGMIEALGTVLPVDTQAFDDVRDAWAFLDADPAPASGATAAS